MEQLFLVSEVSTDAGGHQLLRSLINNSQSMSVIAFTKDCEDLQTLTKGFPSFIGMVVDITKSTSDVAQFLKAIPCPNYIVNNSGQTFLGIAVEVLKTSGYSYKIRERGPSELTFDGIVDKNDREERKILVNVVEERSELKKKSKTITKGVGKLFKGAKTKLNNLTQDDDNLSDDDEEQPLLNNPSSSERNEGNSSPLGCFLSILTHCCPCLFSFSTPVICFRNVEELFLQMKKEQIEEIQTTFRKLLASHTSTWNNAHRALQQRETEETEELLSQINEDKEREEKGLTSLAATQNKNTRDNLGETSSAYLVKRIEEAKSRHAKATVKFNSDKSFREGKDQISRQIENEKAQMQEQLYLKLVEQQLQKLNEIKQKYQEKGESLRRSYFPNTT